jgi:hypothetical protein
MVRGEASAVIFIELNKKRQEHDCFCKFGENFKSWNSILRKYFFIIYEQQGQDPAVLIFERFQTDYFVGLPAV